MNVNLLDKNADLRADIAKLNREVEELRKKKDAKDLKRKLKTLETENHRLSRNVSFIESNTEE
jgi:cell shape-determining protein MreC